MTEEEKKAIEYIKEFKNEVFEGVGNKSIMAKNIDILLNLIDKQQKEIEEKNIAINKMSRQLKEIEKLNFENHMVKKWNEQLDKNCISRDKIREKIKELDGKGTFDAKIVLEHLLEENNEKSNTL